MVDLVGRTSRLDVEDKDDTELGSDEYTSKKEVELVGRISRLRMDDKDDTEHGSDEYTSTKEPDLDSKHYILYAAIDLGTTSSSWAYFFRHEYEKDPNMIRFRVWNDSQNTYMKAPTTILVREDGKTLDKFGYEAEDKYSQFAEDGDTKIHSWYYFKRFQMLFNDRKIRHDMTLQSENGKVLPALTVFALTIEYLKNDLLEGVGKVTLNYLDKSLIRWVLTVPAIWDEAAKQFMREAAVTAGIPSNQLILALEPVAASLYCSMIHLMSTNTYEACQLHPGAKFILIDAGDETIDISAHEVMICGSFNEIYRSYVACGGKDVDKAFFGFLNDFFGRSVYGTFQQEHMDDYLYLCRNFQHIKGRLEPQSTWKVVTIRVPNSLLELFEKQNEQNLAASLKSRGKWSESVELFSDKMRLKAGIINHLYADVLKRLGDQLQFLFSVDLLRNVNIIMIVGEFSESKVFQEMVRTLFPNKSVIVPRMSGQAVLRGAVMFGYNSSIFGHVGVAKASNICKVCKEQTLRKQEINSGK